MEAAHLTVVRQFPVGPGGAEAYVDLLLHGLVQRGFRVTLLCADAPPHGIDVESASVDVVRLDIPGFSRWRPLRPWYFAWLVQAWLRRYPQRLVFSLERHWRQDLLRSGDGIHAEWLARRRALRNPLLHLFTQCSPYHRLTLMSERRAYHPDRTLWVLANSEFVKGQIVGRFGFPAGRVEVIHNGIRLDRWSAEPDAWLRARLGLPPGALLALFVGTGWERKGLREAAAALDAWRKRHDRPAHLAVAGRGPAWRYRHPDATFFGPVDRREMPRFYRGADVLLLPTHYDPFANVTLEALACGLPVVTTRTNGAAEILTEGVDGAVVDAAGDIEALSEKLDLFAEPARRDEIRAACRRKAEAHGLDRHIERVLDLCLKVAAIKG